MEVRKRLLLPALLLAALSAAADPFLLQSENVGRTDHLQLQLATEGGYEGGPIPDWFVSHRLGLGLLDCLSVDLGATWGGFPDQGQVRLDTAGVAARYRLHADSALDLQVYLKGLLFLGSPIAIEYVGPLPDVAYVLSPRAEGGWDIAAGLAGIYRFGLTGLSLHGDLSAAYTAGRTSFASLAEVSARFRLTASVCPAYQLLPGLFVLLQNRMTYWFSRGYMYDLLPQLCLAPVPSLQLALGTSVPVVGGGVWSILAGVRWMPSTKPRSTEPPSPPRSPSVAAVPEDSGMRLRIYVSFPGDRADLFEPENPEFGARNREILVEVAAYLKQFEGYDIVIEGHTNRARFDMSFEQEQREEMLPLAAARAEAVLAALAELGIDRGAMKAAAIGGLRPLADFEDSANNWKNRRVEILLRKR